MTDITRPQHQLILDDSGRCTWPELHDGYLLGLELQPSRGLHILLQDQANARWRLSILDVQYLRAMDFREGNIIFDLCVQWKRPCDRNWFTFLFNASKVDEFSQKIEEDIMAGSISLLTLTSSYGCELALLARAVPSEFGIERL